MKIIIAGAGLTGSSIVSYLSQNKDNDIVVIDTNSGSLKKLSSLFDIQTIHGSSSHPDILAQAGADKADMIMALTDSDEVNMVTSQVAYNIFNIPTKIARIESMVFLEPLWANLYSQKNMPIDYIVSTSVAVADNIFGLIKMPGAHEALNIDNKIKMLSFRIEEKTPIINAQILELQRLFEDINISVLLIIRNGTVIIPNQEEVLQFGDEVIFLTPFNNLETAIKAFGKEAQNNEHILMFGANKISGLLLKYIEKDSVITNVKLIEENVYNAQSFSLEHGGTKVINGPLLNDAILSEANIEKADVTISLTNDDKDNILISMLANRSHVGSTISLLNSRIYDNLLDNVAKNISVDRSSIIASQIIKAIRKPRLDFGYVLTKNYGEIWGLYVPKDIDIKKLGKLKGANIGAVIREEKIFLEIPSNGLQEKDYVILFAQSKHVEKIEEFFI